MLQDFQEYALVQRCISFAEKVAPRTKIIKIFFHFPVVLLDFILAVSLGIRNSATVFLAFIS